MKPGGRLKTYCIIWKDAGTFVGQRAAGKGCRGFVLSLLPEYSSFQAQPLAQTVSSQDSDKTPPGETGLKNDAKIQLNLWDSNRKTHSELKVPFLICHYSHIIE